ncbi:MAG: hypothetical protein HY880_08450, partial [Deltaproteobacteria bacterium]|nr:hypothetical protein [Deltaproteobacteria bacterium]
GQQISGVWTASGANAIVFTPTAPFPADTYTVTAYPTDSLGNSGTQQIVFSNRDLTPPVTDISLSGTQGSDGWYSTSVTVTLTSSDGGDSSGVDKTWYSFNGSAWSQYTGPFVLDTDGANRVYYYSIDRAGNSETAKSREVKINKTGLVGSWRMDNDWLDSSVVGNNAAAVPAVGGAAFSEDSKAGSHSGGFDGANDYARVPNSPTLDLKLFTLEAWIKPFDVNKMSQVVLSKNYQYHLAFDETTGKIRAQFRNAAGEIISVSGSQPLVNNQWYHIAASFDGASLKLYINGEPAGEKPFSGTLASQNYDLLIGQQANDCAPAPGCVGGDYYFKGLVDEVSIFNRPLAETEIRARYQSSIVSTPTVEPVTSPTASSAITLTGTKPADTWISINNVQAAPSDSLTSWHGTFTLQSGENTLNIAAVNPDGHKSEAVTLTLILDNTPPVVAGVIPADNALLNSVASIDIMLSDDRSGVDYTGSLNDAVVKDSAGNSIGGSWSVQGGHLVFTPSGLLPEDSYTVTIYPVDLLGNKGTFSSSFIVDLPPPPPTVNSVTTPTRSLNQIIAGSKPAGTAIIINNVQKVSLNPSTTWSYTYSLSEGLNTLNIIARDAAGLDSTPVSVDIVLDTTSPVFTIDTYRSPSPSATQTISGAKEPGSIVKMNGAAIFGQADLNPIWSYTISLTEGITNHFVFTATDAIGNELVRSLDIIYDISAPAMLGPGALAADGSGKGTEATISWPAYMETSDVAYYRVYLSSSDFTDITSMSAQKTVNKGTKTSKLTGLTLGATYYFAVVPVDANGNYNPMVNTTSGTPVDTAAPEDVTISTVTSGYDNSNGNYITIKWAPCANSAGDFAGQVIYADSGTGYDAGTPIDKTLATFTKTGLADSTKYRFKLTMKDAGGRESTGIIAEAVTRLNNPSGLKATSGNGNVSLAWNKVSGPLSGLGGQDSSAYVKQYNIYRIASDIQQTDARSMALIKSLAPSSTSYVDTGLTNGTAYQYAITAVNTFGAEKTDVSGLSATPRMDETGPVISGFNITQGQVIKAPMTITASATDAESSMDRIELYIDGQPP